MPPKSRAGSAPMRGGRSPGSSEPRARPRSARKCRRFRRWLLTGSAGHLGASIRHAHVRDARGARGTAPTTAAATETNRLLIAASREAHCAREPVVAGHARANVDAAALTAGLSVRTLHAHALADASARAAHVPGRARLVRTGILHAHALRRVAHEPARARELTARAIRRTAIGICPYLLARSERTSI
jgi:hypothetical protein